MSVESDTPLAVQIADVFNHVYQSHRDSEPNNIVLADAAQRMANVFEWVGYGTARAFLDIAAMSGLPVGDGAEVES